MHNKLLLFTAIASGILALLCTQPGITGGQTQRSTSQAVAPLIPRTWDDEAIRTLEVPLADPIGSPKHVSSEYYYRIPVAPIYKSYPIYAPGHEPPGYIEWLKQQDPVIV